jgi:sulfate adenylyltransferase
MTREPIDWDELAALASITVENDELDLVELVQLGLITTDLHIADPAMVEGAEVVIRDVEATPLLWGRARAGRLSVQAVQPVTPVAGVATWPAPAEPVGLAVIVRDLPTAAELARVDELTSPTSRVLWVALVGRTRAGRALLASVSAAIAERPIGIHRLVRVPWPTGGGQPVFEIPMLPDPAALAAACGARHHLVLGEEPPTGRRRDRGGTVLFFTGLSGSGKSTIARAVHDALEQTTDREITLLDGDDVRRMLSAGLGFDTEARLANVRRVSWVAALVARHGGIAITALIAPFAEGRAEARRFAEAVGDFIEIWVSTPLEECERRDRKGLYAQARAGRMTNFTGIDSPYEAPQNADLVIDTTAVDVDAAVELVLALVRDRHRRQDRVMPEGSVADEH